MRNWASILGRGRSISSPQHLDWLLGSSPAGKAPVHEADHSPQFRVEVQNDGGTIPPLLHVFMERCLIICREKFIFFLFKNYMCY
jgi:hypothetical protein